MKNLKKIPTFKTIEEEREFWKTHDSMDYIDWSEAKRAEFPSLEAYKLYKVAQAVEKESALNEEMEAWDVTIADGLE